MARRLRAKQPRRGRGRPGVRQHGGRGGEHGEPPSGDRQALARAFLAERAQVRVEHEVLTRLALPVAPGWVLPLRRAPDVSAACAEALGAAPREGGLLPLRDLLGLIGAHEWRRRGVPVAALGGHVVPHFGVYAPVRGEYVDLAARAAESWPVRGKRAMDVGTGTGVLALLLAQRGATVIATDLEPRAVACARENAERLGLASAVDVRLADLFPEGSAEGGPPAPARADLVVSNPPWVPAEAHTPLDRAVYDPGGRFLSRLIAGIPAALLPGGEAWLVLSDLAERLGLRQEGEVERQAARAGLRVADVLTALPAHPRARTAREEAGSARRRGEGEARAIEDEAGSARRRGEGEARAIEDEAGSARRRGEGTARAIDADPLAAARAAEVTRLFRLVKG
jgi:methylase of polypeptide subunit release factors